MKKFIGVDFWLLYLVAVTLISLIVLAPMAYLGLFFWGLIAGFTLFISLLIFSLLPRRGTKDGSDKGFFVVDNNHVALIEIMGRYYGELEAGYYFIFPFFNLIFIKAIIFKGECEIVLFDQGPDKKVDFKDGVAADVDSRLYYKIEDAYKAVYNLDNFYSMLKDRIESSLRAYMGSNDLDFINQNKANVSLGTICNTAMIADMNVSWGIKIINLTVSDIKLSDDDIKIRRQIMEKNIQIELAEKDKQIAKSKAEADKIAEELKGKALFEKIQAMASAGLDELAVLAFLESEIKWKSLGDKTVVIDDGSGLAGIIAKLKALGI